MFTQPVRQSCVMPSDKVGDNPAKFCKPMFSIYRAGTGMICPCTSAANVLLKLF